MNAFNLARAAVNHRREVLPFENPFKLQFKSMLVTPSDALCRRQKLHSKRDSIPVAHKHLNTPPRTCGMCRLEALSLHRGVGNEAEVHLVAGGDQLLRDLAAAQPTQDGCRVAVPVEGLQMVVRTFLMLLDLKLIEGLERQEERSPGVM